MKTLTTTLITILTLAAIQSAEIPKFLANASGEIEVLLKLHQDDILAPEMASISSSNLSRSEKRSMILNRLKSGIKNHHIELRDAIKSQARRIADSRQYWISDVLYIRGDADYIRELACRGDVEFVFENLPLVLVDPVEEFAASTEESGVESGVDLIGAREAWQMGITGEGSIVCNFDTGVDGDHPALVNNWLGAAGRPSEACWFDLYTSTESPDDLSGHGTHTMGTMVGRDGADTIGVAFGAQWIAAGVVDRGGGVTRTIADILAAFEWAADPDGDPNTTDDMPDVINNSWGIPSGFYGPCDMTFWDAIDNIEALDIVCVFAAGNEGPNESTLRTPADRISTQFNAFSVGALNAGIDEVALFSSRGPSGCDGHTIKPEVVAPGVHVRSSTKNGGYTTMSGTSMAAPHVSGAVALLRQFNPEATVFDIKQALMSGATDYGETGEDNDYGHGLINIRQAILNLTPPDHFFTNVISSEFTGASNDSFDPGDLIGLNFEFENIGNDSPLEIRISASEAAVTILDSYLNFDLVSRYDTVSVSDVRIALGYNIPDNAEIEIYLDFEYEGYQRRHTIILTTGSAATIGIASINSGIFNMSFSNTGLFGLGDQSADPFGGEGFNYPIDGEDILFESSVIITDGVSVSDGIRNESNLPDADFAPVNDLSPSVDTPGMYADIDGNACYSDNLAESPLGVEVSQRLYAWELTAKFLTLELAVRNSSDTALNNITAGLYCDWNFPVSSGGNETYGYAEQYSMGYFHDGANLYVGIRPITSEASSYRAFDVESVFTDGFTDTEKAEILTGGVFQDASQQTGDYAQMLSVGPFNLEPGDSAVVAFAIVMADSYDELMTQADLAFHMYPGLTGQDEPPASLPNNPVLYQNYPNPFNASTTIEFDTYEPGTLEIYDIMGRLVNSYEIKHSGHNLIQWDGINDRGAKVVSGVYLYRLSSGEHSISQKMVYLK